MSIYAPFCAPVAHNTNDTTTKGNTMKVTVNANILACASRFAGKKDVRYYLNFVRIEAAQDGSGIVVIATDGHRIVAMQDETGTMEGGKACAVTAMPKIKVPKGKDALVTFADGRASMPDGSSVPAVCEPDGNGAVGRFPDWRVCMPWNAPDAPVTAAFNGHYLGAFADVPAAYGNKYACVTVHQRGERAALVTFGDAIPAIACCMPMRQEVSAHGGVLAALGMTP